MNGKRTKSVVTIVVILLGILILLSLTSILSIPFPEKVFTARVGNLGYVECRKGGARIALEQFLPTAIVEGPFGENDKSDKSAESNSAENSPWGDVEESNFSTALNLCANLLELPQFDFRVCTPGTTINYSVYKDYYLQCTEDGTRFIRVDE